MVGKKLLVFCLVLYTSHAEDLFDDNEAKEKIHTLIGAKQLEFHSTINEMKTNWKKMEAEVRVAADTAKASLTQHVEATINKIQDHVKTVTKSGITPSTQPCVDALTKSLTDLSQHATSSHESCLATVKASLREIDQAIIKFAEFQSKFGRVPVGCKATHDSIPAALQCIQQTLDSVAKEMQGSKAVINDKFGQMQGSFVADTFNGCNKQEEVLVEGMAKEAMEKFENCVKQ